MGQNLTHGIYLPDEGERNCYDGLAGNWQLLDGAVGTVAEHTTALAGKAPLVHTHTKSDVTDLFNSANEWAGNQTYTGMMILNSSSDVTEQFRQKLPKDVSTSSDALVRFNTLVDSAGHNVVVNSEGHWDAYVAKSISLKYKNDSTKQGSIEIRLRSDGSGILYAQSPFECDLGNSSNQWNNLYAKNYYYNGVAWGLDKANVWTTDQIIQNASINLKNTSISQGSSATTGGSAITLIDKNNQSLVSISTRVTSASRTIIELNVRNTYKNGVLSNDQGAELIASSWYFGHLWNGTPYYTLTGYCDSDIIPKDNNSKNLGTSNLKWKTLNGVNPGALSLPNSPGGTGTENVNYFDLSGNITVRDGSTFNRITASCDGWIAIGTFATWLQISNDTLILATTANPGADGFAQAFLPVRKGNAIRIVVHQTKTQFQSFKLLPCEGNV